MNFRVHIRETQLHIIEIEADSPEEAEYIALDRAGAAVESMPREATVVCVMPMGTPKPQTL